MTTGQIVLLVYALLIEVGGVIGFLTAGSKPSLIAGSGSAGLLFAAFAVSFFAIAPGLWAGAGIAVLLVVVFGIRLTKTRKFMPSGMLVLLSILAFVLLAQLAIEASKAAS